MRHILTLFDGRVVVLALALLALAALFAVVVGRRTGTVWQLFLALCGSALVATDLVANALGIAAGAGAAIAWTRRSKTTARRRTRHLTAASVPNGDRSTGPETEYCPSALPE